VKSDVDHGTTAPLRLVVRQNSLQLPPSIPSDLEGCHFPKVYNCRGRLRVSLPIRPTIESTTETS
jgi:hypothetical protein